MTVIAGVWRLDGLPDAAESCVRMLAPSRRLLVRCELASGRRLMQSQCRGGTLRRRDRSALSERGACARPQRGGGAASRSTILTRAFFTMISQYTKAAHGGWKNPN
jgi:hypothetical protein